MKGFENLYTIGEPGLSYQFHVMGLWSKIDDGALFFGFDSGCSCPAPWEDKTEQDLTPLTRANLDEFERAVRDFPADLTERRAMIAAARWVLGV